jgi:transposase-like protein
MKTPPTANPYKRHRFPAEIISHCVWLYFRFCLSYRDVEELMAERGISLTYEAVRYWCRKFVRSMPINSAGGVPDPATSGTWKCARRNR